MTHSAAATTPEPVALLQKLIRFDTTNPPGNEAECIAYIDGLLQAAGIETQLLALDPNRPNLIARIPGQGNAPPLLLQGHVDVVTTENQNWRHPPFAGNLVDGYVWGRGALDMKGGVAMMITAVLRAVADKIPLPGDVILTILSDEENGGAFGAKFLVEQHPHLFEGVRYALGEFGGFSLNVAGRRLYPIMVAEKQLSWLKAIIRGPGGHGSRAMRGGAMAKLGRLLTLLDQNRLPVHVTPVAQQMIEQMAAVLPAEEAAVLRQLLDPAQTDQTLEFLGKRGLLFDPILHNTINATIVRGGGKINVIPSLIELELDGRLLPGFKPADLLNELEAIVGALAEWEVIRHEPGPPQPDMGLFDRLAAILKDMDPEAVPVPYLMPGVTDARFFCQLGIQTYGFLPMPLPPDLPFAELAHNADERIPASAVEFGAHAIYTALMQFGDM